MPARLLDLPPYPAEGYARLADRIAALLGTASDVLLVQGEAIVALEAVATSLAEPGLRALNVVTSPYGAWFGRWLARGGAEVTDLAAPPGRPIAAGAVAEALRPGTGVVALVHAESATGILNPLPEIAALARRQGALLVVDAVASVGGHWLEVDALGADVVVVGPQKALAGSSGVSAVAVSAAAWARLDRPGAPRGSVLSLVDLRRDWLERGRGALPGMPSALEFRALEAALDRVEAEGLAAVVARHGRAARAARRALAALGLSLWVPDAEASALVTAAILPPGRGPGDLAAAPPAVREAVSPAVGRLDAPVVRFDHTGRRAAPAAVAAGVRALAAWLGIPGGDPRLRAAEEAVAAAFAGRE
jgi:aspartate aminotransferase-like enzyme